MGGEGRGGTETSFQGKMQKNPGSGVIRRRRRLRYRFGPGDGETGGDLNLYEAYHRGSLNGDSWILDLEGFGTTP
jgi:hypothetical protein